MSRLRTDGRKVESRAVFCLGRICNFTILPLQSHTVKLSMSMPVSQNNQNIYITNENSVSEWYCFNRVSERHCHLSPLAPFDAYYLNGETSTAMYYPDPWPVTFFAGENSDDDQKYCTQLNGVVQWGSRRKRTINFFPANTLPRKLKFSAKEQCQNYTYLVIILSMQCFCQLSLSGTSDLFVLVLWCLWRSLSLMSCWLKEQTGRSLFLLSPAISQTIRLMSETQ